MKANKISKYDVICSLQKKEPKQLKGIIHGVTSEIHDSEILQELKQYHVTSIKRLGKKQQSESVILFFESQSLPEKVVIGYRKHNVKDYIPPPVRCFKCNKFGHVQENCRNKITCPNCGENHQYSECKTSTKRCVNCGEDHSAAFRGCRAYKHEQEIISIKIQNNITYAQATKQVSQQNKNPHSNSPGHQIQIRETQPNTFQTATSLTQPTPAPTAESNTAPNDALNNKIRTFILTSTSIAISNIPTIDKASAIKSLSSSLFQLSIDISSIHEALNAQHNLTNTNDN